MDILRVKRVQPGLEIARFLLAGIATAKSRRAALDLDAKATTAKPPYQSRADLIRTILTAI